MIDARLVCVSAFVALCGACGSTDHGPATAGGGGGAEGGASSSAGSSTGGSSVGSAGKSNAAGTSNTSGTSNTGGTTTGGSASQTAGAAGANVAGAAGSSGPSEGPGTITEPWRDYCVATFTEDYPAKDAFGAPLFTALAGEQYLLIYYPEPFSRAQIAYLTSTGPYAVDVNPNAEHTGFPFTTDCPMDLQAGSYFAVFADVSVYAEPALTTPLCDLKAGTALPRILDAQGAGYALESSDADSSTYEVFLNAFSPQCGDAAKGYIRVPHIQLFGTPHVVVPFRVITGPK